MKNIFAFPRRQKQVDFDSLMRPHLDALYRISFRFCQHQEDAEDLLQDLMIKLYPRCEELDNIKNLKAWLTKSLYHLFIDGKRKNNRSPLQLVDDETTFYESTPCHELGPEQQLAREQRVQQVQCVINQLSDEHRGVLVLHDIEGYRLSELQEMLGVPVGTLKSRIHRARARMRDMLQTNSADSTKSEIAPAQGNLFYAKSVK